MSKYNEVMENITVSKDMRDRILSNVEKEMAKGAGITSFDEAVQKKGQSKIVTFRKYAGIAAAFAVLVVGAYAVNKVRNYDGAMSSSTMKMEEAAVTAMNTAFDSDTEAMETEAATETMAAGVMEEVQEAATESAEATDFFQGKEFSSLAKMSAEAGTNFKEIQYLDSFSSGKDYFLYGGNIAFISYDVEGNRVVVRQMDASLGDTIPEEIGGLVSELDSEDNLLAGDTAVKIRGNDNLYTIAEWVKDGLCFQLESSEALTYEDMKELMEQVAE